MVEHWAATMELWRERCWELKKASMTATSSDSWTESNWDWQMVDEMDSRWDCGMVEHLAPMMEMSMARWSERSWESSKSPLTVDRMDLAMEPRSSSLLGCGKATRSESKKVPTMETY
jgi:hypothetical protein